MTTQCVSLNNSNKRCKSSVMSYFPSFKFHEYCSYHYNKLIENESIKINDFAKIINKYNNELSNYDKYVIQINKYKETLYNDTQKMLYAFDDLFISIKNDINECYFEHIKTKNEDKESVIKSIMYLKLNNQLVNFYRIYYKLYTTKEIDKDLFIMTNMKINSLTMGSSPRITRTRNE